MARNVNRIDLAVDVVCGIALMVLWLALAGPGAPLAAIAACGAMFGGFEVLFCLVRGYGAKYAVATAAASAAGLFLGGLGYFLIAG